MNITIIGDSYASDIPFSWVHLLSKEHAVNCLSQPGCSEYKIWLQSQHVPTDTDVVIVSHTSWTRIPVESHPVHKTGYHENCDLMFADCEANDVTSATEFYTQHFWPQFWQDTYKLYRNKISEQLHDYYVLHLDFFDHGLGTENNKLNFSAMCWHNKGDICHMTQLGNQIVRDKVQESIRSQSR